MGAGPGEGPQGNGWTASQRTGAFPTVCYRHHGSWKRTILSWAQLRACRGQWTMGVAWTGQLINSCLFNGLGC